MKMEKKPKFKNKVVIYPDGIPEECIIPKRKPGSFDSKTAKLIESTSVINRFGNEEVWSIYEDEKGVKMYEQSISIELYANPLDKFPE